MDNIDLLEKLNKSISIIEREEEKVNKVLGKPLFSKDEFADIKKELEKLKKRSN